MIERAQVDRLRGAAARAAHSNQCRAAMAAPMVGENSVGMWASCREF
jgi:hypothetical protein